MIKREIQLQTSLDLQVYQRWHSTIILNSKELLGKASSLLSESCSFHDNWCILRIKRTPKYSKSAAKCSEPHQKLKKSVTVSWLIVGVWNTIRRSSQFLFLHFRRLTWNLKLFAGGSTFEFIMNLRQKTKFGKWWEEYGIFQHEKILKQKVNFTNSRLLKSQLTCVRWPQTSSVSNFFDNL